MKPHKKSEDFSKLRLKCQIISREVQFLNYIYLSEYKININLQEKRKKWR